MQLTIKIYLDSQQRPPTLRNNRYIAVQQNSSVNIMKSDLRATHDDVRPRYITYHITSYPLYGQMMKFIGEDVVQTNLSGELCIIVVYYILLVYIFSRNH